MRLAGWLTSSGGWFVLFDHYGFAWPVLLGAFLVALGAVLWAEGDKR